MRAFRHRPAGQGVATGFQGPQRLAVQTRLMEHSEHAVRWCLDSTKGYTLNL